MEKIDQISVVNNKTGEIIPDKYKDLFLNALIDDDKKRKLKSIIFKFKNNRWSMTIEEIELYRKIICNDKSKSVQLKYSDGFYMVNNEVEDKLSSISLEANGFIHRLGFHINKHNVIIYKGNNKPVKSFGKLREILNIPDKAFRRIKKESDKHNIVVKDKLNGNIYMSLNPEFSKKAHTVSQYSFMAFSSYYKEKLSDIDYLYLCKKFDINP